MLMETTFIEKSFGIIAFDPWSGKSIVYPKKDKEIIQILNCKIEEIVMVEARFIGDKTKHRIYTTKERAEEYLMNVIIFRFLKSIEIFD